MLILGTDVFDYFKYLFVEYFFFRTTKFGFISLFNGISTFASYLILKPSLKKISGII